MVNLSNKKEIICSQLSDSLDEISTKASMLCSSTHDRVEVERNMEQIIKLIDELSDIVHSTKNNFLEWKSIINK